MTLPLPMPKAVAPTDNLYKFAALFGLTLIVVACVLLVFGLEKYNQQAVAYQVDQLLAQSVTSAATQGAATVPANVKNTAELQKEAFELSGAKAILNADTKGCTFLLVCGGVISVIGFAAWWWRLQRHLDKLLQAQVEKEVASIKASPTGAAEESAVAEEE